MHEKRNKNAPKRGIPVKNAHEFAVSVEWTGNRGEGTRSARGFGREHRVSAAGKPALGANALCQQAARCDSGLRHRSRVPTPRL